MQRPTLDDDTLITLSRFAGLDLSAGRRSVLSPALEGLLQQFDVLYDVDVGEAPPLHSFDPRWGDEQ